MTPLFLSIELSLPSPPALSDRPRARVQTGTPRLLESSHARRTRQAAESWASLLDAIDRSATVRLALLDSLSGSDRVECPWKIVVACTAICRCEGLGKVRVDFLRRHYAHLATEIAILADASRPWRSS